MNTKEKIERYLMNTREKIEVMQAYLNGKEIQEKGVCNDTWETYNHELEELEPSWDWFRCDYRIKPEEEKPRLMTNRELAEWVIKTKGMIKDKYGTVQTAWYYNIDDEKNSTHIDRVLIRPWGSEIWVEPTYDIYERDCKGVNT